MSWRIGVDTGGTFTDVVATDDASRTTVLHKVHSTPDDPSRAVVNGVLETARRGKFAVEAISLIVHGSTVATNAVLTQRGARVVFVTTRGFRDVLLIRRQARPEMYNLRSRRPPALVPRARILEIDERCTYEGVVLHALTSDAVDELEARLADMEFDAAVVGLLNSYVNPEHERMIGKRLRAAFPTRTTCLSHEISGSQGEFERFSTAVLNGYVQPIVSGYLENLDEQLRAEGVTAPVFVMKSNGGVAATSVVTERSVEMLLSGPAGGVVAGSALAGQHANANLITTDMGGTSFDVSLVHEGSGVFTQERVFAGQVVHLPMMDIDTIGAGGGSIGWVDAGGALRVGPQSAGAAPGPACYGHGGTEPTVTDANLILGRLAAHSSMAGGFELDVAAARNAMQSLAEPLGLGIEAVAEGMLRVVNANMTSAIRRMTVARGHDPAVFALCPFGGAGPLHGADLAREIGVNEVIIPAAPGVFSACGLLMSELREEQTLSRIALLRDVIDELPGIFDELLAAPTRRLGASGREDVTAKTVRRLRLRFLGQGHDLCVDLAVGPLDVAVIESAFHAAHRRAYGYDFSEDPVEMVAAWVSVSIALTDHAPADGSPSDTPATVTRPVIFNGDSHQTPVYDRVQLGAGFEARGPAVIEQPDTTTIVLPGQVFNVDAKGQIIIHDDG